MVNSGSILEDESQEDEMLSDQMASEEKEQGGQLYHQTNREILNNP